MTPFKDYQARYGVVAVQFTWFEELDEDEGVDWATPGAAAVHSFIIVSL